ncbi:MAG: acetyl-CoA carboxylase biotin carboxyl carrier protein [bacterium]
MKRKIRVTDTTLRDGHQSLWATRMPTDAMLPIAEKLDEIGYHSLEVWGGATFDVCMRFLDDDPWERLRLLKKHVTKTPLQMLLRGQNLVGYRQYADDVVERFVAKSIENGIDIIRMFDALNDLRNLEQAMKVAKREGGHVQAAFVYTISPVATLEYYLDLGVQLKQMGADSLCIKDMAGLLTPFSAYELITRLKEIIDLPIQLHTHYVGGLATMTYLKGIEAGVDIIDTASAPLAFGASQPPIETITMALSESPYELGLDLGSLFKIANYFDELRDKYGFSRGVTRIRDMRVFEHQVPGGMISNLVSQLEQQKALHRIHEVLAEIPRVREELGYPPLVTPTSQIVGTQSVFNVLLGKRYKVIPDEVKNYFRGLYGKPPAPVDPKIKQMAIGDEEPVTCRPGDLLKPEWEKIKQEAAPFNKTEEDILSYAIFPQVAREYFSRKGKPKPAAVSEIKEDEEMNVKDIKELVKILNETDISELSLESEGVKINIRKGSAGSVEAAPAPVAAAPAPSAPAPEAAPAPEVKRDNVHVIEAPMVGTFYTAPSPDAEPFVQVGSMVNKDSTLCIIEAMKLMNEIEAEVDGRVVEILAENGQAVEYGQPLFVIEKA